MLYEAALWYVSVPAIFALVTIIVVVRGRREKRKTAERMKQLGSLDDR